MMQVARWTVALAFAACVAVVSLELALPGGIRGMWAKAEEAEKAEPYTCPMVEHAHVRAPGPGRCPECGMDLVPLSKTSHKGHPAAANKEAASKGSTPTPSAPTTPVPPEASAGASVYYCPMHPEYISDRPGDCPICNMSLVPLRKDASSASGIEGRATVQLDLELERKIGLKVQKAEKRKLSRTIRAAGRVDYDETRLSTVNLKFGGWIEDLYVSATGQEVRKDEPLFLVYSPDLLEAQRNYLLASRSRKELGPDAGADALSFAEETLRSARERLLLWDFRPGQLDEIDASGEPQTGVKILSEVEGVVLRRNVVEGSYAEPMKDLYEIADISRVWIHADIYEQEIPLVSPGVDVTLHLEAMPGEFLQGKISYVYPYLNEETRTLRVRIEMENPHRKLKPGMYATVALRVDLGEQLAIAEEAVLDSGTRQIVFVESAEGRLEPREVRVGNRGDGLVAVLEGVREGELVVTSGNFLVDSESRLKAALLRGFESRPDSQSHSH